VSESLRTTAGWLISAAVVLTCVLFLPSLADPVNVVKLTVLLVLAIALALVALVAGLKERVLRIPVTPTVVGLGLLTAFVVAAIAAPTATTAVIGTYGRNSGLLAYAAATLLFLVGLHAWTVRSAPILALGLALAGLFTATYGLLQYAGVDAIAWNNPFNPIIASLGNPDFASGYLGIATPAAAWGALWTRWALPWRLLSAAVAALCLTAAGLSAAVQGPLAAAAGLTVLAVAWLLNHGGTTGRRGLTGLAVAAGLGVAGLAAGAAHLGPATPIFTRFSFTARTWYWGGALHMFRDHPLLGVGLDHFGAHWRQVRPVASTQRQGGAAFSDAAHSVPLQMLAQGGLVLALAYLAFTVLVAVSLIRGLRRLEGQDRLLLGGLGGAWAAYVVQSLVSIDQVPLLTVQFATAGAVVALSSPRIREFRLPGALPVPAAAPTGRRGRPVTTPRTRELTGADWTILSVAGLAGLWLLWLALLPMRADAAIHTGDLALAAGNGNGALSAYQKANRLVPGVGQYWEKTGQLYEAVKQPSFALEVYARGARHDPYDVALLSNVARLAQAAGHAGQARSAALRAAALDPTNPATIALAAQVLRADGDPQRAVTLIERVLRVLPQNADLWAAKGASLAAAHDTSAARTAYQTSLKLDPNQSAAKAGLSSLGG
jgi:putative inorganic carbon (HCO3(-)) transporter